ncbi:MAG: T9SS type A sorting domain-containing protein [Cyclobacteriaceae bacterium]
MKFLILLFSLAIASNTYSQIYYESLFESSNRISSVSINNNKLLVQVENKYGYTDDIYFSSNAGSIWDSVRVFSNMDVGLDSQLLFSDLALGETNIYLLCDSIMKTNLQDSKKKFKYKSYILKSPDHGVSWTTYSIDSKWRYYLYLVTISPDIGAMDFIMYNDNEGYVLIFADETEKEQTILFKTNDGCKTFEKVNLPDYPVSMSGFYSTHPDTILVEDSSYSYMSYDGGISWKSKQIHGGNDEWIRIYSCFYNSSKLLFAGKSHPGVGIKGLPQVVIIDRNSDEKETLTPPEGLGNAYDAIIFGDSTIVCGGGFMLGNRWLAVSYDLGRTWDSAFTKDEIDVGLIIKLKKIDDENFYIITEHNIYKAHFTPNSVEENYKADIVLSPNPAGDFIEIANLKEYTRVELYSSMGAKILETHDTRINISHLAAGIYFLKAGGKAYKFIKK